MAIVRVQTIAINSTSLAFASNNTAGNFLVAVVRWGGTFTVSDSQGNTWQRASQVTGVGSGPRNPAVWYAANCKAGANTVSISGGTFPAQWQIAEYSGLALTNVLGATSGAKASTNGQVYNSGNVSSTGPALFIGFVENETQNAVTDTPSGGLSDYAPPAYSGSGNVFLSDLIAYAPSTKACAGTLSVSVNWSAQIAVFYPPTSGVPNSLMMMGCGT